MPSLRDEILEIVEKDFKRVDKEGRHYRYSDTADLFIKLFEQRISPLRKVYEDNKELSKTFKLPIVIEFWQAIKSVVGEGIEGGWN